MKLSIATVLSFAATAAAYQPAPATFSLGNFGKKKDAKKAPAKVSFGKDVMMTSLWLAGSGSFVITVGGSDEWIHSLRGSLREDSSLTSGISSTNIVARRDYQYRNMQYSAQKFCLSIFTHLNTIVLLYFVLNL